MFLENLRFVCHFVSLALAQCPLSATFFIKPGQ
jgi:hypothetical protein